MELLFVIIFCKYKILTIVFKWLPGRHLSITYQGHSFHKISDLSIIKVPRTKVVKSGDQMFSKVPNFVDDTPKKHQGIPIFFIIWETVENTFFLKLAYGK